MIYATVTSTKIITGERPSEGTRGGRGEILRRNGFLSISRFTLSEILSIMKRDVKKENCFSQTALDPPASIMLLRQALSLFSHPSSGSTHSSPALCVNVSVLTSTSARFY